MEKKCKISSINCPIYTERVTSQSPGRPAGRVAPDNAAMSVSLNSKPKRSMFEARCLGLFDFGMTPAMNSSVIACCTIQRSETCAPVTPYFEAICETNLPLTKESSGLYSQGPHSGE